MQAKKALLLIALSFSATAADVSRHVPDKFLGDWCTQYLPGVEDTGESDIRLTNAEIGYYRDSGKILAAAAIGDQLTLIVELNGEGRRLTTHEFELSEDGKTLSSAQENGQIHTRIKCQTSSLPPPNNSFKPRPLRGLARDSLAGSGPA